MAGRPRRGSSFLSNIVQNISNKERQPKEGLIQILDIPSNLSQIQLENLTGVHVPVYDGKHFCHAFFKKRAKTALKNFLERCFLPSSQPSTGDKAKAFSKSPEFSTVTPLDVEEDFVLFCNITVSELGVDLGRQAYEPFHS